MSHASAGSVELPQPDQRIVTIDADLVVMDLASGDYSTLLGAGGDVGHPVTSRAVRVIETAHGVPICHLFDDVPVVVGCLVAALLRRRRSPRSWIDRHERLYAAGGPPSDGPAVARLVRRFRRAALIVPGLTVCLINSMVLADFLRRHGVGCRWVFGVRTYPFEAHCWLEWDDAVLNDDIHHIGWFTPILVA